MVPECDRPVPGGRRAANDSTVRAILLWGSISFGVVAAWLAFLLWYREHVFYDLSGVGPALEGALGPIVERVNQLLGGP